MASFTIKLANLAESGPIVEVNVIPTGLYTQVFDPHRKTPPKPVGITAMFDTGATGSVIQTGIPGRLGLNPIGFTMRLDRGLKPPVWEAAAPEGTALRMRP